MLHKTNDIFLTNILVHIKSYDMFERNFSGFMQLHQLFVHSQRRPTWKTQKDSFI